MNKQELIAKIVKDTGATKAAGGKVLESVMDGIGKTLKKGDTITFVGFGTFKTSVRKARTARNPRTGEPIKIAEAPRAPLHGRQGPEGPRQVAPPGRAGSTCPAPAPGRRARGRGRNRRAGVAARVDSPLGPVAILAGPVSLVLSRLRRVAQLVRAPA